jgi:integrase
VKKIAKGIYLRGATYWYARQVDRKRTFISLQTSDEQEAIKRVAEVKTSGVLVVQESFDEDIARFLAAKQSLEKHTERSAKWFEDTLKQFSKFVANKPANRVTEADVIAFYKNLRKRVAETTAKSYMGAIRSFFAWSVKARLRFDNPTKEVKIGKISHPARTVFATKKERDAIIDAAKSVELKFVLLCAFHAGMRFNEICEARREWFQVSKKGGFVHIQRTPTNFPANRRFIPKNKKNRTVPLTATLHAFILDHKLHEGEGYILEPDKVREFKYRVNFRFPWNDHMKKCGFDYSPHDARHTFASLLAQKGVSIYKIASWIGDTLDVCMKHYAHLAPTDSAIKLLD